MGPLKVRSTNLKLIFFMQLSQKHIRRFKKSQLCFRDLLFKMTWWKNKIAFEFVKSVIWRCECVRWWSVKGLLWNIYYTQSWLIDQKNCLRFQNQTTLVSYCEFDEICACLLNKLGLALIPPTLKNTLKPYPKYNPFNNLNVCI